MKKEPVWNVILYDYNTGEEGFRVFNVFNSYYFYDRLIRIKKELKKNPNNFEWFNEQLNSAAFGAFCGKFEYEMWIIPHNNSKSERVDVYGQLKLNWNLFAQYTWDNIKHINKSKMK